MSVHQEVVRIYQQDLIKAMYEAHSRFEREFIDYALLADVVLQLMEERGCNHPEPPALVLPAYGTVAAPTIMPREFEETVIINGKGETFKSYGLCTTDLTYEKIVDIVFARTNSLGCPDYAAYQVRYYFKGAPGLLFPGESMRIRHGTIINVYTKR